MYQNVVVGADDSPTALEAVRFAASLAHMGGGKLHIVTAYKPGSYRMGDGAAEFRESMMAHPADLLLSDLSQVVAAAGVEPEVHPATGDPAETVCRIAGDVDADLVVVGNKGMKGARRVLGSVPNDIAHRAPCSVLIVNTTA